MEVGDCVQHLHVMVRLLRHGYMVLFLRAVASRPRPGRLTGTSTSIQSKLHLLECTDIDQKTKRHTDSTACIIVTDVSCEQYPFRVSMLVPVWSCAPRLSAPLLCRLQLGVFRSPRGLIFRSALCEVSVTLQTETMNTVGHHAARCIDLDATPNTNNDRHSLPG